MDSNGALSVTTVSKRFLFLSHVSVTMVSRAFGRLALACEVAAAHAAVEASREVQLCDAHAFTYPEEVAKAGVTKSVAAEKALKNGQPGKR